MSGCVKRREGSLFDSDEVGMYYICNFKSEAMFPVINLNTSKS